MNMLLHNTKSTLTAPFTRQEYESAKERSVGTFGIDEIGMVKAIKAGLIKQKELDEGYVSIIKKSDLLKDWDFGYLEFHYEGKTYGVSLNSICYWVSSYWLYDENHDVLWSYENKKIIDFKK